MSTPTGLPPIFETTPIELAPSQIIAEFPVNTFLESIAIAPDNTLFIANHFAGHIIRIGPDQTPVTHAVISGKATGLAFLSDGDLLLTGWNEDGISTIFKVSSQGVVETLLTVPEALFFNGLTYLTGNRYVIADSYRGAIWELDAAQASIRIWLEHPLLARTAPDREIPAVNGLKIFSHVLYASNTEKQHIVRIPILDDAQPGEPTIFTNQVNIDDFAFDCNGTLYGTTHIYNSVVKVTPDGTVTTIAQAEQGMAGTTALAFGRTEPDQMSLYVVTNGGMSLPLPTGLESAKVIRLEVGAAGLPLI
ncbi:gluconolactonase [Leptolyngbya sp. 'hensonii']|uniref:SMP-30/gluconolactonase/LRE family protein n=1 Tax=Leptolyngbya sp. 'hensonii' TaxID=1922337 RepID=UPI00094FECE8|nr:gluconolactonase [Leptolyngbya sp. 'hensonii']OLP17943.1 gluconolactonase [Leptolyngbya sp. 'hensonii']